MVEVLGSLIDKRSIGGHIDRRSQFASASEADRFLLGISFGAQWDFALRGMVVPCPALSLEV
jgi:hypothetical protein